MHICQKYMKFFSFTHFCRESKSVAIHALYPESFCMKNLAIRKVLAFSDSVVAKQGFLGTKINFIQFSGYFESPGTKRTVLCSPGTDEKGT